MTPPGTLSKHTKGTEAQVGERVSVSMLASLGPAHQALHAPWGWRGEQLSSCFPERRIWMQNAEAFNISILEETAGKGTPSWREWQAPCSWLWDPSPMLTRPTGMPDIRGASSGSKKKSIQNQVMLWISVWWWVHCLSFTNISFSLVWRIKNKVCVCACMCVCECEWVSKNVWDTS